jgi:hypothetical protein
MIGELYTYQMLRYKRIIALYLTVKQKGLCHLCHGQIGALSPIVKKHCKPLNYYHVHCAKRDKLDIIWVLG